MLWALYTAIIGIVLMQYSAKKGYEAEIMAVFALIQTFLLLMLVIKNPFVYVWETYPKDVEVGFIPANGRGLNPLLQTYWMVIHPPILFIGFASMSVPFCHAVSALLKHDYAHWIRVAAPWTVFGAMALGTGLTLGGYWAYETLGWGGYWGWDPVENSSLIPWLVCLASVHTMVSQRRSGSFVRTNFVLSLLVFILVLYSTFLTRSGVLGDTSVHSFVEPGMWAYVVLVGVIFVFAFIGFGLFFKRMKEMPKVKVEHSILSREFALLLGAFALSFCAVFVLAGTSSPLITGFFFNKASVVDSSFYTKTTLPMGIIITLLSGIGQLLWWKSSKTDTLLNLTRYPFGAAVLFTLALIVFGLKELSMILLTFGASFTLFANVLIGYRILKGNPRFVGGSIAHIGIAFMFLGIIGSTYYSEKQTVELERGKPVEILKGYTLKYVGYQLIDSVDEKYAFNIQVEKGEKKFLLAPIMWYSDYTKGIMRNPDIANLLTRDFYLSPLSLEVPDNKNQKTLSLKKGETKQVDDTKVKFVDFDFNNVEKGKMLEGNEFAIGIILEVQKDRKTEKITPAMKKTKGEITYQPAKLSGSNIEFSIVKLLPDRENPSNSAVEIGVSDPTRAPTNTQKETLIVETSLKPYINVLWIGTATVLFGFFLTIVRRAKEVRLQ